MHWTEKSVICEQAPGEERKKKLNWRARNRRMSEAIGALKKSEIPPSLFIYKKKQNPKTKLDKTRKPQKTPKPKNRSF